MPYVRVRGNQLALVHGERESGTGKVQQRILFTIYSKAEALEIVGRGSSGADAHFQALLQREFPELKFNWKKVRRDIEQNLSVLPERYEYAGERLQHRFRKDLCTFSRTLIQADPKELLAAARVIQQQRHELEYLVDLIRWRLKLRDQEPSEWNADNPFDWRFTLQGRDVPPETGEHAAGFYERGEYEKAEAIFRLLVDCFDDWADGHLYLGLIAYQQHKLDEAAPYFQKAVEFGRKILPDRRGQKWDRHDRRTQTYMQGLHNLALTFNEMGRYKEALTLCRRLVDECGDVTVFSLQAAIFLNTGQWEAAIDAAQRAVATGSAEESFVAALARLELDQAEQSLEPFLSAALHYPRAARMLVGLRMAEPMSPDEARDDAVGVSTLRKLHGYLEQQSRRSKQFFSGLVKDRRVARLLNESLAVARQRRPERGRDRSAFDRRQVLRSPAFARDEAYKLRDLISAARRGVPIQ